MNSDFSQIKEQFESGKNLHGKKFDPQTLKELAESGDRSFIKTFGDAKCVNCVSHEAEDFCSRRFVRAYWRHLLRSWQEFSFADLACNVALEERGIKKYVDGWEKIKITGVDFMQEAVDKAVKFFKDDPNVTFMQGDVLDPELPDQIGLHDVVMVRHLVEHLPGYREPLEKAWRIAKDVMIVVLFKPLKDREHDEYRYWNHLYNRYDKRRFLEFCQSLTPVPIEKFTVREKKNDGRRDQIVCLRKETARRDSLKMENVLTDMRLFGGEDIPHITVEFV